MGFLHPQEEWRGAWSRGSRSWMEHPHVASDLAQRAGRLDVGRPDGAFWCRGEKCHGRAGKMSIYMAYIYNTYYTLYTYGIINDYIMIICIICIYFFVHDI